MKSVEVVSIIAAFVVVLGITIASFERTPSERRRNPGFKRRFRKPRSQYSDTSDGREMAKRRVPEIGNGYRWFDYAYNTLWWFLREWRRQVIPLRMRAIILRWINNLLPFSEHDRHWAQWHDNRKELVVPDSETVTTAGLWVLEIFTPSALHRLEKAIKREGWKRRRWYDSSSENSTRLERSRSGSGSIWWGLADFVEPQSTWFIPDATRTQLPPEFRRIELQAIQVGEGLTAVVAHFHLNKGAARSLDREWHRTHTPILVKDRPRWSAHYGEWSSFWQTQRQRQALHDKARSWLVARVPGYFAGRNRALPLLDLLLFDQIDPLDFHNSENSHADVNPDIFRALGLSVTEIEQRVSKELPGLLLSPLESRLHPAMGDVATWTLWGKRSRVIEEMGGVPDSYGGTADEAIAYYVVEHAYNMFTMFGVDEFLDITGRELASLRDKAVTQHGRFKASAIRGLRKEFLRVSIDLAAIQRDVRAFWKRKYQTELDADFVLTLSPRMRRMDARLGRPVKDDVSFNEFIRKRQLRRLRELSVADTEYRDILSTVASLGASADSYTLSRLALVASIASLIVALGAILFSSWSDENVLSWLVSVLRSAGPGS